MMKTLKHKTSLAFILHSIVFMAGVLGGAILQKSVGVGNVLRLIGIPYPTSQLPGYSTIMPPAEIPQAYRGYLLLFILAGQSNMVGWAPIPDDDRTDPRIFVFGNDYQWRLASEPVDSAYNQVDRVSLDRIAFFGPSMAFALASLDHQPQAVIGLIPCAKNSSAILQWQRNLSDQTLYGSCLKRARAASTMGHISGILFFQGETDAQDPALYPQPEPRALDWARLFATFITDLRIDLQEPNLPVVYAQLGTNPLSVDFSHWEVVKEQQSSVDLPMTAMITTDDLPLLDGLHYTADSYRVIGERFAKAYWDLVENELPR